MSCDHNREKFFEIMAESGQVDAGELERTFQSNRCVLATNGERLAAEAKTRLLFDAIQARGLKPPTHSPTGLPRQDAQAGYAAVYDLLRNQGLIGNGNVSERLEQRQQLGISTSTTAIPSHLGPDGRDRYGFDRWGYNKYGFDQTGRDRQGYDVYGLDRRKYNRHGFKENEYDAQGFNAAGYDEERHGRDGLTYDGYDPTTGLDPEGYSRDGYDKDGYDRDGYDRSGRDRNGLADPTFAPDAQGFYPDGLDAYGFGRDGYDKDGYDRYGFGRDGYNRSGFDRNGYDRNRRPLRVDPDGYDGEGYRQDSTFRRVDRAGFDQHGFDANGFTPTGFNQSGNDANGQPRMTANGRGKLVPIKYNKKGIDEQGYDRWGFHKDTGLSAPDAQGRRINTYGWVYDEQTKECYDPKDPTRRTPHQFSTKDIYIVTSRTAKRSISRPFAKVCCEAYFPPTPPPPITPFASMSYSAYSNSTQPLRFPRELRNKCLTYDQIQNRPSSAHERRPNIHPAACKNGIRVRCPHCGQFTGGEAHICPNFGGKKVIAYHSGLVQESDYPQPILATPFNPDYDPRYDVGGGYDSSGRDRDGVDRQGYNERGFDREGYTKDGFDIFGYDRDGFDRHGYNNAGVDRQGERRPRTLEGVGSSIGDEDLLANQDLARLYSQIATGLVGKPRRVVLKEGEGFATDMKGTIYADPYPLGHHADPRHNLVVTRAGIYHELGHEQFTPTAIWEQVLAVHQGQQAEEGLGQAGSAMLPRFYNIVEDGRMERQVSANYAGAAEILAASCRLEPRWGEEVGTNVPDDQQVFWALLYTALPYYRVRPEVRDGMTPRARALFDELTPQVTRAVHGSPDDAYRCAVHLARRFEEEGLLKLPPKEQDYSRSLPGNASTGGDPEPNGNGRQPGNVEDGPSSPSSSQTEQAGAAGRGTGVAQDEETRSGRGQGAAEEDERKGRRRAAPEEEPAAKDRAIQEQDPPTRKGQRQEAEPADSTQGSQADEVDEWLLGNETVDTAIAAVERDAAAAIEAGMRARNRAETIGRPLHRPLPAAPSISQRYRGQDGMPVSVDVALPVLPSPPKLEARRERHRQVASLMARPLRAIREQAEQRLRRQPEGKLDRRQLVNAVKGLDDVHTTVKESPRTSFAVSVAVDMSSSMDEHIRKMELYDAVMVLDDTFGMLGIPDEVRAFGSHSAQIKSMDQPLDPRRAAALAAQNMGGTTLGDTAGLGQSSLLAREEANRLMICLSDGDVSDQEKAARTLRQARQNGIVTFGIFLGKPHTPEKLDDLYGKGNWAQIQTLSDMPKAVAQRLSNIFKSMR